MKKTETLVMSKKILLVDDEKNILRALYRLFAGSGYHVSMAESGTEALEILRCSEIDLMLTDIRMPGMDGFQLLQEVKSRYPLCHRLVLSGQYDEQSIKKFQHNCLAKLNFIKPWNNQEVLQIVENIFRVEDTLKSKRLLEAINKVDYLPSPNNIYQKFSYLVERNAGLKDIAAVIEKDPATAAKVLQVANSAFFRLKTGSIQQAVSYLGLDNIKTILINCSFFNELDVSQNSLLRRDLNTLWTHAVMTNQILHVLHQRVLDKIIPETGAMAGLLHDIGKILLLSKYTGEYTKVAKSVSARAGLFYYYEEMEFLEKTHAELGGYLLDWWELPYSMIEAALFHHCPADESITDKTLVALVHIADIFSWYIMFRGELQEIDSRVYEILGITRERCEKLLLEIAGAYE